MNQLSIFLETNLEKESPNILKNKFSWRAGPSIFNFVKQQRTKFVENWHSLYVKKKHYWGNFRGQNKF